MAKIDKHTTFSILLLAIIFAAGFAVGNYFYQKRLSQPGQQALVTQVVDGDTIVIEGGNRIRLLGINAPEKGEELYKQAKDFLESKILHKEVKLEKDVDDKDRYGRYLRYIWLNDTLVNAEVAKEGLAVAYFFDPNKKYQYIIAKSEQEAIEKHVGIWALEKNA